VRLISASPASASDASKARFFTVGCEKTTLATIVHAQMASRLIRSIWAA
jgi:hypothetical protein